MLGQEKYARRRDEYAEAERRNPYLIHYEEQRRRRGQERLRYGEAASGQGAGAMPVSESGVTEEEMPARGRASAGEEAFAYIHATSGKEAPVRRRTSGEEAPARRRRSYGSEAVRRDDGGQTDELDIIGLGEPTVSRRGRRSVKIAVYDAKTVRPASQYPGRGTENRRETTRRQVPEYREADMENPRVTRRPASEYRENRMEKTRETTRRQVPEYREADMENPRVTRRPASEYREARMENRRETTRRQASEYRENRMEKTRETTRHPAGRKGEADREFGPGGYARTTPVRSGQARPAGAARRRGASLRKRRVMRQRLMVGIWVLCLAALGIAFWVRNQGVEAGNGQGGDDGFLSGLAGSTAGLASGKVVQGLPAEVYARHPDWEENFLTPNEYSRPGEALESVTNIFVHYTANPGTSAAQNRSYFEQQKDMHEASVSAHFIIGYDGEIIQCVPLNEIAYAVMTRNYDSVSIECCYKSQDGSFTQETYDSLISLLAWLTDAYELDTEDILRHYDCGGKKCPLYYTEHEDAWEQLKKDVDKL